MDEIDFPTFLKTVRKQYIGKGQESKKALFRQIVMLCSEKSTNRKSLTEEAKQNAVFNSIDTEEPFSWSVSRKAQEKYVPEAAVIDDFRDGDGSPEKAAAFHFLFLCKGKYKKQADAMNEVIGLKEWGGRPIAEHSLGWRSSRKRKRFFIVRNQVLLGPHNRRLCQTGTISRKNRL